MKRFATLSWAIAGLAIAILADHRLTESAFGFFFPNSAAEQVALTARSRQHLEQMRRLAQTHRGPGDQLSRTENWVYSAAFAALLDPEVKPEQAGSSMRQTFLGIVDQNKAQLDEEARRARELAEQNRKVAQMEQERKERLEELNRQAKIREAKWFYHDLATAMDGYGFVVADGFTQFEAVDIYTRHKEYLAAMGLVDLGLTMQQIIRMTAIRDGNPGGVPDWSLVSMSPNDAVRKAAELNAEINRLKRRNPNDPKITQLQSQLDSLFFAPGMFGESAEDQDKLSKNRQIVLDQLAGLLPNIVSKYREWQAAKSQAEYYHQRGMAMLTDEAHNELNVGETVDDETGMTSVQMLSKARQLSEIATQAQREYLASLNGQGLLAAEIEIDGFKGPLWQYLNEHGTTGAKAEQALGQAADVYTETLKEHGTFVLDIMSDAEKGVIYYGNPLTAPLRQMVGNNQALQTLLPGIQLGLDEIVGIYDTKRASDEFEEKYFDTIISVNQAIITIVVIVQPETAPVLVPIGLALTGLEVKTEYDRYDAAAEQLNSAQAARAAAIGIDNNAVAAFEQWADSKWDTFVIAAAFGTLDFTGTLAPVAKNAFRQMRAIRSANMAPGHADAFIDIARQRDEIIMIRPVNPHATDLIANNAATKSMHIKGKSSNWGPHAGLIPVDQRLSKMGAPGKSPSPEKIAEYNELNYKALGERPILDEAGNVTGWEKIPGVEPVAIRVQVEGPDGKMIDVLGDPKTGQPITADYDLFAVGSRNGPGGVLTDHPDFGNIGIAEVDTMDALNEAVKGKGYAGGNIVHHGPANRYAKHFESADFPITCFTPDGNVHVLNDVQDVRNFYDTWTKKGYQLDAMNEWNFDQMPATGTAGLPTPTSPGAALGAGETGRNVAGAGTTETTPPGEDQSWEEFVEQHSRNVPDYLGSDDETGEPEVWGYDEQGNWRQMSLDDTAAHTHRATQQADAQAAGVPR